MTSKTLEEHLQNEHNMSPVSTYLKEIVYGGSDGIVTTFAVVAGFAGAQMSDARLPIMVVLLFGLANLTADGASMGLSSFLSLRSEQDYYKHQRQQELEEILRESAQEKEETIQVLLDRGYSQKDAEDITRLYSKNPEYWADFMMNYELELANPTKENALRTGLATTTAFITFGFIPLVPYIFFQDAPRLFTMSCIFTLTAFLFLGIVRWKVTKQSFVRCVGEMVLVGSVSASIAYFVGSFFKI